MSLVLINPIGGGPAILANVTPIGRTDPGFGVETPIDPGYGRPGIGVGLPGHELPGVPGRPGHDLPWAPARPGHELPPEHPPEAGTKPPPGTIYPPLPPDMPVAQWILVWLVGVGYRWVSVDKPVAGTKPVVPPGSAPKPA